MARAARGGRDDLLATAFALDSVAVELLFTLGPLIAAIIIAVASPMSALVVSAACSLVGTVAFIARPPSRDWRPHAESGSHGPLGALRSAGVRTIVFSSLPVGFCFGAVEISLPAFAEQHGARELAGVLLATWSVASVAGGLVYGARTLAGLAGLDLPVARPRCCRSATSRPCSRRRSRRWRC